MLSESFKKTKKVAEDLRAAGIKCFAFDNRKIMVTEHVNGRLKKEITDYVESHDEKIKITFLFEE